MDPCVGTILFTSFLNKMSNMQQKTRKAKSKKKTNPLSGNKAKDITRVRPRIKGVSSREFKIIHAESSHGKSARQHARRNGEFQQR